MHAASNNNDSDSSLNELSQVHYKSENEDNKIEEDEATLENQKSIGDQKQYTDEDSSEEEKSKIK